MGITTALKNTIEQAVAKHLSSIDKQDMEYPDEVIRQVRLFKDELWRLESRDENACVMHTETILMKIDDYHKLKEIIWLSANTFNSVYCYVSGKTKGVVFIGFEKNIYVAKILYSYLSTIALTVRQAYMDSLKRFKSQKNKEKRADEYLDEWMFSLMGTPIFREWYNISNSDEILSHVNKHFTHYEARYQLMKKLRMLIKPFCDEEIDDTTTWGEVKEEVFKTVPREAIHAAIAELIKQEKKDHIISFPYQDWFEKNQDFDEDD